MNTLKINREYITLQQFLKIENIIQSGGEAKYYLIENDVFVNGQIDRRRGKKLYPSDKIKVAGKEFTIV